MYFQGSVNFEITFTKCDGHLKKGGATKFGERLHYLISILYCRYIPLAHLLGMCTGKWIA